MIKEISFNNIYNFDKKQTIKFDSNSHVYAIFGDNGSGKTNLLDIIENSTHSLYQRVNYESVKTIVNKNSDNRVFTSTTKFIVGDNQFEFSYGIDTENECYVKQCLREITNNKLYFLYENNLITSNVLSERHKQALYGYDIKHNGIMVYISELDDDEDTLPIKEIYNLARVQDYIEVEVNNFENDSEVKKKIIETFNYLNIDIRDIVIYSSKDKVKKKIQNRIVDRRMNRNISDSEQFEVWFVYDKYKEHISESSRGTRKIFDLCLELYAVNSDNYFAPRVIDEMSTSLSSAAFFYILDKFINETNRQLVFSTNNLMVLENKTLPKESIIFTNKHNTNYTITKLSDYKDVRNDKRHNWRKKYLSAHMELK